MFDSGYQILPSVLSPGECDRLVTSVPDNHRRRAGARHLMGNREVAALALDSRLLHIAADVLGGQAQPYRATLFHKSGRANWLVAWHQDIALPLASKIDSAEWGPWSTKAGCLYANAPAWALERIVALRIHLDASTCDNGPLRVVPGSHGMGVLGSEAVNALARRAQALDCIVDRGGVLAMRPLLIHSSSRVLRDLRRRVLHIEYANCLELGPGVRLAVA